MEDDQAHPVAALVGIGEQGEDGALGGAHALGDRHRPGGIDHEQHQVGGLLDADLALKIGRADGKGHPLAQLGALALEGGGGAHGGVKGQVIGAPVGGARLDVAAALALGVGARAAPGALAIQLIQGGVQLARGKGAADLDLLAPIPPIGIARLEDVLLRRLSLSRLLFLFDLRDAA